jgi:hypothetical protein
MTKFVEQIFVLNLMGVLIAVKPLVIGGSVQIQYPANILHGIGLLIVQLLNCPVKAFLPDTA